MLNLLKNHEFRNFFFADIISSFGVGMTTVGANWYLLAETHSNQYVGIYLTLNVLAGFLMAPLAGSITDRFSRKTVIFITFLVRGGLIALIALYFASTGFSLWLMYLLALITGAGWITYMAASRSYVQTMLPKGMLGSANSFIEISLQVGMFTAGAASGVILHYTGFTVILVINALVFLVSSLLIVKIKKDPPSMTQGMNSGLKGGLKYILHNRLILIVGLLSILPLIVTQLFNVSSPDYVATILRSNSVVYGFADMSYGIGGLVSGLLMASILRKFRKKIITFTLFSIVVLALIVLFLGHQISLMYIASLLIGLANSSLRIVLNTILMTHIDSQFMGRATSLWNGMAQFIEIFASTYIGVLNDSYGANYGFLCMAFIMAIGMILTTAMPKNS
ncbi:MFS transporter [Loigolactobacillus iwatensis]|uniref:MFS transporter n=1 Tax=Loigolactobacillus iwatensis TaxID=1267156 RepID=UPI000F7D60FA|nr:MFS transporter [Loigolactobacillus iwatensis]